MKERGGGGRRKRTDEKKRRNEKKGSIWRWYMLCILNIWLHRRNVKIVRHHFLKDLNYNGFIMYHLTQRDLFTCCSWCQKKNGKKNCDHLCFIKFAVNFVQDDVDCSWYAYKIRIRTLMTVLCDNGDYYPKFGFASFMLVLDKSIVVTNI